MQVHIKTENLCDKDIGRTFQNIRNLFPDAFADAAAAAAVWASYAISHH